MNRVKTEQVKGRLPDSNRTSTHAHPPSQRLASPHRRLKPFNCFVSKGIPKMFLREIAERLGDAKAMDSSFGVLDAFAFVVFAVLILVAVIIVVSLGKLSGHLAQKWGHPQAAAITAMSWIGIATGGLLWPIAFIWAVTTTLGTKSTTTGQYD